MSRNRFLQKAFLGGSIIAAIASSLCCIGPLIAALLGAGGFAAASAFEQWRPLFLTLSVLLLAIAWWRVFGKHSPGPAGEAAPVSHLQKLLLLIGTAIVLLAASSPYWIEWFQH